MIGCSKSDSHNLDAASSVNWKMLCLAVIGGVKLSVTGAEAACSTMTAAEQPLL